MREILFRAKRIDNGEWVEGHLIKARYYLDEREIVAIISIDAVFYPHSEISEWEEVIPETIGQYTGLCDKNDKKIFEGDIVRRNAAPMVVAWNENDGSFMTECFIDNIRCVNSLLGHKQLEVIGNIHDNPELLEVKA